MAGYSNASTKRISIFFMKSSQIIGRRAASQPQHHHYGLVIMPTYRSFRTAHIEFSPVKYGTFRRVSARSYGLVLLQQCDSVRSRAFDVSISQQKAVVTIHFRFPRPLFLPPQSAMGRSCSDFPAKMVRHSNNSVITGRGGA